MEYALSNDSISIKVSTAGGSFTSIEAGGREYLWQGDPAVWSGQAPVCFPICGGLRDGSAMTFAGHHVKLARHGFARKQEWKLLSQSENELAMCLASEDNAALLSDYPYPFKLVARYTLERAAVRVSYEVTNEGTEDMPFFIGGHPGFRCPLDDGEAYTDYELRFEKDEAAELCTAVPSTGLIDVANRSKNPMVGKTLPLSHELFDFAETIFDVLESRQVTLSKKGEDKGVRLSFEGFPYLIVWSKPEGDFVAVEPWGGLSTCSDEDDVLEHKRGCLIAKPKETVVRSFTIEIL
ncbi:MULTISPECIES: aldose 1-epimerase family protein [unclassified Collinsella]|uniref:aldose 1-epimerase family protein n=1 Tax=unclassified Collinsella TaxID=2637548 RepID=UPI000E446B26|nr:MULTISPECIES: aldose 1-epimerase family protein [unclassified Collinsella]RGJ52876.1 aldose 1-epimerase family protein [Collinsella sp. TM06-3]RHC93902.1 aldose 1-epimerase family protein [Collinsella sp. AM33-4BH]RHJ59605.1 aldose 1-epimerase family protein [Collinsella sp. AM09-41]